MSTIWKSTNHIIGLIQRRFNSIANALELHHPCIHPSRSFCYVQVIQTFQNPIPQFHDFILHEHVPYHVPWWCDEHGHVFCVKGTHWYTVTLDSPHTGPIMWSFDISFVVSLNKLLKKLLSCQWFQMPWYSCDNTVMETHQPQTTDLGCYDDMDSWYNSLQHNKTLPTWLYDSEMEQRAGFEPKNTPIPPLTATSY